VPTAICLVVVFVYRPFSFWIPTLIGITLVPYFAREKRSHVAPVSLMHQSWPWFERSFTSP